MGLKHNPISSKWIYVWVLTGFTIKNGNTSLINDRQMVVDDYSAGHITLFDIEKERIIQDGNPVLQHLQRDDL